MKKKNKLTIWDDEYTTALFGIIFFLLIVIGFGLLLNFIFGNKAAFVFQKIAKIVFIISIIVITIAFILIGYNIVIKLIKKVKK